MKCPKCQHENPENAKFCQECGNRLIAASESVRTSSIPDAERKRVTALFSDLSGYTAMTEKLDPEEVKEITSSIFDGIRDVVGKYEGSIERFSGDGVLSLFGVPKAHEDDPIRAIRAAREIHELVQSISPRYAPKIGRTLSMHSGVNTGLAVTADVNPQKGTHGITGDAVNVAARLSDIAEARDILVGPDTYRASQSQFTFQPLKPTKVKGKSESIPIYKVISEKAATDGVSQETHIFSGDFQSMRKSGKKAIEVSEDPLYSIFGKFGFGVGCFLCGQFKEAEDVLQSMVDFSEKRGEAQCLIWAYLFLGPALIANGRMDQGLKLLKKGQQAIVENQRKGLEAVSEYVLGKIYSQIATGPKPSFSIMVKNLGFLVKNVPFANQKAIKHFSRVIGVSEEIGAKGAIGPAYLELGLLYKAKGRTVKARECISQAIQDFERCEAETYLKQAKEALETLR